MVQRFHAEIIPDTFMSELIWMNFENHSHGCRPQDIRLVRRPWKATRDDTTKVVLKGMSRSITAVLKNVRCYIKRQSLRLLLNNAKLLPAHEFRP